MASTSPYNYWLKDRKLGIGKYNSTSATISAPAGFALVEYCGPAYADRFTEDLKQESQLPRHFHRALIAGVLRDYYEDKVNKTESDIINQRMWSGIYKRFVTRGREYTTMGKQAGILEIQPSPFGI